MCTLNVNKMDAYNIYSGPELTFVERAKIYYKGASIIRYTIKGNM
jgi:hypothetical protein